MELRPLLSIVANCAGAFFVMLDIGGDYFLMIKHRNDFRITGEDLFAVFFFLTVLFILLGGLLQFGVAVFLSCTGEQDGAFKILPAPIRILVFITAPFLLAPVIVNVYGAYAVIRYGRDNEPSKVAALLNDLKMAETIVESLPQIMTQCVALRLLSELENRKSIWEPLELLSITTATLSTFSALFNFISVRRRRIFVSRQHPPIVSLAPLGLVILLPLLCGTVGLLSSFDMEEKFHHGHVILLNRVVMTSNLLMISN